MNTWAELKRRKVVQWTIAYLAGAWLFLDVTSLIGGHMGWPRWIHQALIVLAGAGLPIAVVVAWYHGDKGRQRVSGPEAAMVAALLVLAAVGVHLVRPGPPSTAPKGARVPAAERSIAVLPLDDLSAGGAYPYFADAMTEEITSALTEVPELMVKSRSSASRYEASELTVAEFAREIGVRHVLEGSVQRSGDRVRVTIQLIDARTDDHMWSETYERTLTDLFELQADIARQVADRLAATFTDRERARIVAGATEDPVAYDLYLRATSEDAGPTADATDLLRRAVERDPDFWPAWEALAFRYEQRDLRGGGAWADSSRVAFDRAIEAADHPGVRLRLEASRSLMFGGEGDEEAAIARLRAAAEERPSDLFLVDALADYYRVRGRLAEAASWRWRAARLDPLNPDQWRSLWTLYWWAGSYEAAYRALRRAMDLDPGSSDLYTALSLHWQMQGGMQRALAALDTAEALSGGTLALRRGFVHWWGGDLEGAIAAYAEVDMDESPEGRPVWLLIPMVDTERTAGDSARAGRILDHVRTVLEGRTIGDYEPELRVFSRLQLTALEGDRERAVRLFHRYLELGGHDPTWFEQSPLFEALRADPEFRDALAGLRAAVDRMRQAMERELPSSF
ncbi:MAG: hypothetical protein R3314_12910 [Longimicrobiales bacterium]|nr:hypothetical protein [Longimicrobiales bacterium]